MTEVVELKAPCITKVLDDAKEDLENAELSGFVGKVFNPIRDEVLVPATTKAGEMLPYAANAIPFPYVDEVGAFAMSVPFAAMKAGYSLIPRKEVDDEANEDAVRGFEEAFKRNERPKPLASSLMGVVGFACNSIIDILTIPFNGKFGDWLDATKKFLGFMMYSGVGSELLDAFADFNALENMLIIGRVQNERNDLGGESRRARTAMSSLPANIDESMFKDIIADASRYVKYASAAYGVSMIDSADLLQVYGKKVVVLPVIPAASEKARKKKIARYVNVQPDDIVSSSKPGGSMDILGHFVTVDKKKNRVGGEDNGAVVLAIRGTYTLSGLKVDASAYSQEFCEGYAHTGIALRTEALWDHVKDIIVTKLLENPGFDLVITGHSLGAGASALLALKLKYEDALMKENELLKDVKIRSFAFAPPPVYFQTHPNEKLTEAMKDTYPFIHEEDCVPFCSADAIRKMADTMSTVDKMPKGLGLFSPLMASGLRPVSDEIKEAIYDDRELPPAPGTHKLAIPAPFVMWMRHASDDRVGRPMYNTMFCRTKAKGNAAGTNDLNIQMSSDMISDHMNPMYERAIMSVREQMLKKQDGFVFPPNPEEEYN